MESNEPPSIAPPTRVRHGVLLVLCSLAFLAYLDRIAIMRVQGDVSRDLGLGALTAADERELAAKGFSSDPLAREKRSDERSKERMGWVFAAFLAGYVLFEVPGGWLADRLGPRRVIVLIVIFWSLFTALTGLVRPLASLLVDPPGAGALLGVLVACRFLVGLGEGGAFPSIGRANARWFPFGKRGGAQGIIWMSSRLGGALAPVIVGGLVQLPGALGSWRGAFVVLGAAGILWAVGFSRWFRDRPEEDGRVNEAEGRLIRGEESGAGSIYDDSRGGRVPWRRVLFSGDFLAVYLTGASVSFSWYFCVTFLPRYLKESFGVDYGQSEILSGLPLLVGGAACLLGGRLSDWLIWRLGSKRWGRSLPGAAGFALAGGCMLLLPQTGSAGWAMAVLSLACLFQDLAIPCLWSLPADKGGRFAGTVAGVMNGIGSLGGALSPIAAAWISDRYGWGRVFLVYAASYFAGALLWLRIDAGRTLAEE